MSRGELGKLQALPQTANITAALTDEHGCECLRRQTISDSVWLGGILIERCITRLFSDKLGTLPGWANYLDYPILVLFALYVLGRVRYRATPRTGFGALVAALFIVIGGSALINLPQLHLGAATLFIVGLLEPLAFMLLAHALSPGAAVASALVRILFAIGWLQILVVAAVDVPVFLATQNPDVISGTFGENPYQLTFFLITWNALILSQRPSPRFRAFHWLGVAVLQVVILVIFLLAQFRAVLPFALLTWLLTYFVVYRNPRKGVVTALTGAVIFAALFLFVSARFPELKWNDVVELGSRSGEAASSGKVQAMINYGQLVMDEPHLLVTGTGPGTYASRGFRTFSIVGREDTANVLYRRIFNTGYYSTDVATRYVLPVATLYAFGSATIASPWFSYLAVPAELGLLGLALVLAIYGRAALISWRNAAGEGAPAALAAWACVALSLLLQLGFIENWLEVSRVTVPTWLVFGVALAHSARTRVE